MEFGEQLERIRQSGFIAILRGDDTEKLIQRGFDLADAGCKIIEVTLDSTDAMHILHTLSNHLPEVMLGVGTVMRPRVELADAVAAGARFALSPIHPEHFVEAARKYDVMPVPGVATPDELWRAHVAGAPLVKLFPASQWSPSLLRSLPSPLRTIATLPTGGVHPKAVQEWLEAGAFACGIGSALTAENAAALIRRLEILNRE